MAVRHLIGLSLAVAGAAVLATQATAGVQVRRVDAHGYPSIRMMVVVPRATMTPPALTVDGARAAGFTAQNLGARQSVALVIDSSQSMHGATLADAIRAARAFVGAKPASDQITVITAGSQATTAADFSSLPDDADAALGSLKVDPRYGTALYDSLVLAAKKLRANGLPGRVIILVTDGQETTSKATLEDAVGAARDAGAAIYTVGIPDLTFQPKPLEELSAATGGRFYRAPTTSALPGIYTRIGAELRRTWQLDFFTAARPGETLALEVRAEGGRSAVAFPLSTDLGRKKGGSSSGIMIVGVLFAAGAVVGVVLLLRSSIQRHRWARHELDY
jgi:von Willebrand factor type A domain